MMPDLNKNRKIKGVGLMLLTGFEPWISRWVTKIQTTTLLNKM
jgi:hypothetical protein